MIGSGPWWVLLFVASSSPYNDINLINQLQMQWGGVLRQMCMANSLTEGKGFIFLTYSTLDIGRKKADSTKNNTQKKK